MSATMVRVEPAEELPGDFRTGEELVNTICSLVTALENENHRLPFEVWCGYGLRYLLDSEYNVRIGTPYRPISTHQRMRQLPFIVNIEFRPGLWPTEVRVVKVQQINFHTSFPPYRRLLDMAVFASNIPALPDSEVGALMRVVLENLEDQLPWGLLADKLEETEVQVPSMMIREFVLPYLRGKREWDEGRVVSWPKVPYRVLRDILGGKFVRPPME